MIHFNPEHIINATLNNSQEFIAKLVGADVPEPYTYSDPNRIPGAPAGFSFDQFKADLSVVSNYEKDCEAVGSDGLALVCNYNVVCAHCLALPQGVTHNHAVVAVIEGKTLERAWFNVRSISGCIKHARELEPNDGQLGDWQYDCRLRADNISVETMTLTLTPKEDSKYEAAQYIWKLTNEYQDDMATSWYTGLGSLRLGVWAD